MMQISFYCHIDTTVWCPVKMDDGWYSWPYLVYMYVDNPRLTMRYIAIFSVHIYTWLHVICSAIIQCVVTLQCRREKIKWDCLTFVFSISISASVFIRKILETLHSTFYQHGNFFHLDSSGKRRVSSCFPQCVGGQKMEIHINLEPEYCDTNPDLLFLQISGKKCR